MKKLHHVLAVAAMLLLVLALLLTSFQLAIYGDPDYRFYEREYAKYNVTESLDMEMEDVMDVTEKMMDYLIGRRPELSSRMWTDRPRISLTSRTASTWRT